MAYDGTLLTEASKTIRYFGGSLDTFQMSGPAGQKGKRPPHKGVLAVFPTRTTSRSCLRKKDEMQVQCLDNLSGRQKES